MKNKFRSSILMSCVGTVKKIPQDYITKHLKSAYWHRFQRAGCSNMTNAILKEKRVRKVTVMFLRALSCVMERYVHVKYYGGTVRT